jgi:hypothetical protein
MNKEKVWDEPEDEFEPCGFCSREGVETFELEGVDKPVCYECAGEFVSCSVCGKYHHQDAYIGYDMVEDIDDLIKKNHEGKVICPECYNKPADEEIIRFFETNYMISSHSQLRIYYSRAIDDIKSGMERRKKFEESVKEINKQKHRNTLIGCPVGETYVTEQGWLMHKCTEKQGASVIWENMTCSGCGAKIEREKHD